MRALVTAALLATAATRGGCEPGSQGYDPCAGKTCGQSCTACDPKDPSCVETAVVKACDAKGFCAAAGTFVCSAADCAGKACGVRCDAPCPAGLPCPAPVACDGNGSCVPVTASLCSGACAGKACGDACTYDPPCRLSNPPCMMPSYAGHCDGAGACVTGDVSCAPADPCDGKICGEWCDPCNGVPCMTALGYRCDGGGKCVPYSPDLVCPPADPCAGKQCGDGCSVCTVDANGVVACLAIATACDRNGECVPWAPTLCYDPCAGKTCGESCSSCGPDCMTFAPEACNLHGECVLATPYVCYDPCAGRTCGEACSFCPPDAKDCAGPMVACMMACDGAGTCTCAGGGVACP